MTAELIFHEWLMEASSRIKKSPVELSGNKLLNEKQMDEFKVTGSHPRNVLSHMSYDSAVESRCLAHVCQLLLLVLILVLLLLLLPLLLLLLLLLLAYVSQETRAIHHLDIFAFSKAVVSKRRDRNQFRRSADGEDQVFSLHAGCVVHIDMKLKLFLPIRVHREPIKTYFD